MPEASSATRTDAEIRDIPQSIQVIPQEVIKQQQAIRLEETVTNVSGVISTGNQDGRSTEISIRGFNQASILRDGFRLYNGNFQGQPEVANLESVEILKGPASVLYGEIEPGGLINLVTKKPLAEPYYDLQLQFGNRSLFRSSADLSGALTQSGNLTSDPTASFRSKVPSGRWCFAPFDDRRALDSSYNGGNLRNGLSRKGTREFEISFEYSLPH